MPNYQDGVFEIMTVTSVVAEGSTEAPAEGKPASDEVSALRPSEDVFTITKDQPLTLDSGRSLV